MPSLWSQWSRFCRDQQTSWSVLRAQSWWKGQWSKTAWLIQVTAGPRLGLPQLQTISWLSLSATGCCWASHSSLNCNAVSATLFSQCLLSHLTDFVERIIMFTQLCVCSRLRTVFRFEYWQPLMQSAFHNTVSSLHLFHFFVWLLAAPCIWLASGCRVQVEPNRYCDMLKMITFVDFNQARAT